MLLHDVDWSGPRNNTIADGCSFILFCTCVVLVHVLELSVQRRHWEPPVGYGSSRIGGQRTGFEPFASGQWYAQIFLS